MESWDWEEHKIRSTNTIDNNFECVSLTMTDYMSISKRNGVNTVKCDGICI